MLWVAKPAGWRDWMDLHKNARSCPASRAVLVERVMALGWTVKGAAEAQGLSERAAYRWLARYRQEGPAGLMDRSPRPKRVARRTSPEVVERMVELRRTGMASEEIAAQVGVPRSTDGWVPGISFHLLSPRPPFLPLPQCMRHLLRDRCRRRLAAILLASSPLRRKPGDRSTHAIR